MTFIINMEVPITSWEFGHKRQLPGKIPMQVTYSDGGYWANFEMERDWVVSCITRSQFVKRFPERKLQDNLFAGIHALKFPSGAIFDCVLAQHPDKEIRRRCWR